MLLEIEFKIIYNIKVILYSGLREMNVKLEKEVLFLI